ncbi:MAG TPA: acetate uptake transporter [Gaiellales bacterium]|jgi:succinate-acetate transporter protein|nr:acetate uptake transporter [Gaiellales bacterium]
MASETYREADRAGGGMVVADPAPLGLGAFALTTFMLSAHNAGWAPDVVWIGVAIFYGGIAQLLAGMWEFRNRNVFGATAFSTYGGFWLSLGSFVILATLTKLGTGLNVDRSLGWFLIAFAIFNSYMLLWSARVNKAVFLVFLTLEATEVLLFWGFLGTSSDLIKAGGYMGVITALVAWYASAAGVVNGMSSHTILPVGAPMWTDEPRSDRPHRFGRHHEAAT